MKRETGTDERAFHATVARVLQGELPRLETDAGAFVRWCSRHRLAPYFAALDARAAEPALAAELKRERLKAAAAWLLHERRLSTVLSALTDGGARPILFKGAGVACRYYPSPEQRPIGDLDLLFRRDEMPLVVTIAERLGFRQKYTDPLARCYLLDEDYNVPLIHPTMGLFEAHHALYRDCARAYVDELERRLVAVTVLGVRCEMMAPPDLFVVLATHWATSDPGSSWVWLLDLVLIGRTLSEHDWLEAAAAADRHGLQLFLVAALQAMSGLWLIDLPRAAPIARLEADLTALEKAALNAMAERRGRGIFASDRLRIARRLSGRPFHHPRWWTGGLVSHPGAVCIDLEVSSQSPWFWIHRVRHAGLRAARMLAALNPMRP
jgi:hypothetical protein